MFIGKVEKFYSDFYKISDLILPMTVSGKFDGEIVPSWSKTCSEFILNQDYLDSP
ncbi:hypothetical protein JW964_24180 [candidate division KSB1 bacterium]|nr:hypothetical protein [candidate division KSB1 bacterium]